MRRAFHKRVLDVERRLFRTDGHREGHPEHFAAFVPVGARNEIQPPASPREHDPLMNFGVFRPKDEFRRVERLAAPDRPGGNVGCLLVAGVLGRCLKEVMAKLKHKMRRSDLGEEEYKCVRK